MTGGGPPLSPRDPENYIMDISLWLPNEFIVDSNEFDSDKLNQV